MPAEGAGQGAGQAAAAPLTREELARRSGADPDDVDLVTRTLTGLGLEVIEVDPAGRRVRVAGPVDLLSRVFGTSLEQVSSTGPAGEEVTHRHRTGGLSVPGVLDGVVTAVLGLDDRPQSRAQFRITPAAAASTSYTPVQLGAVYGFPEGTDGSGQTVAIIELGGGYEQADLDTYFGGLGLSGVSVRAVGVDGAANVPGKDPQGADGEVMLDIEVVGALAPKAEVVVYFAPNTDAGFLDAVTTAAQASPAPVAMSISWGQSEDQWTAAGPHRDGRRVRRRGQPGRDRDGRRRRQRQRRRRAATAARTWTSRPPARTSWPAAARRCARTRRPARSSPRRSGTTAAREARPVAA